MYVYIYVCTGNECSHEVGFINIQVVSKMIVYKPYWKCDVRNMFIIMIIMLEPK